MQRKKEQPRDPHTGQYRKQYVFNLDDTKIPARPERARVAQTIEKTSKRKAE